MNRFSSRLVILVLVAFTVGAGVLLGPEPALADQAMFRVQRTFLGAPFPPVANGAGRATFSLYPAKPFSKSVTENGATMIGTGITRQAGVASVLPGNPISGKFTLPRSYHQASFTSTLYPSTAFTGYLSRSIAQYVNGRARFRPVQTHGAAKTTHATFHDYYPLISTTANGQKNYTTTFNGRFDFSRNGYLAIEPGPHRFGGTIKTLYDPNSSYYQYISYFTPLFFKGYGTFGCTQMGVDCTEDFPTYLGGVSSSGAVTRKLLQQTPVPYSTPTAMGKVSYRPIASPAASSHNYYLHLNAPFTTGMASAYGAIANYASHPVSTGYDKQLGGANITLTRTYTSVQYKGAGKTYYPTKKYYTKLTGVTRVVSLVKPRITHTYQVPRLVTDPLFSNYQANRVQIMKVFFLPEPTGALMLGSGIVVLLGLLRIRRGR